jgi:tetratricopeptide (TPR) repeat protein
MALALLLAAACATGGGDDVGSETKVPRRLRTVREYAQDQLTKAQEALAKKELEEAERALDSMYSKPLKVNDYERALMWELYGLLYTEQGNRIAAIDSYEQAIASNLLDDEQLGRNRYHLGVLYLNEGDEEAAIRILELAQTSAQPSSPDVDIALASALRAKGDLDRAIVLARGAVEQRPNTPGQWLLLLGAIAYEKREFSEAAVALDRGISGGSIEPSRSNLELLANAWSQAKEPERALAVFQRISDRFPDGTADAQIGRIHAEREDWPAASAALERALGRGGLPHPGRTNLLLGVAFYHQQDRAGAAAAFERARSDPETADLARAYLEVLARGEALPRTNPTPDSP